MEKKRLILTVLMVAALFAVAFAKDPGTDNKPAREGNNEFYQTIVLPVMRAQHEKLLQVMTKEDAAAAKKLGAQWRENLLMLHELRCEAQAARIQLKDVDSSLEQEIEAQRIMLQSIVDRAEALAHSYQGSIHMLMGEMRAEIREKAEQQNHGGGATPKRRADRDPMSERGPEGALPVSPEVRFMLWSNPKI